MSDDQRTIYIVPGVYTPEQLSNMILGDELYAGERPEDAARRFAGIPAAHTITGLEAIRQQWATAMEELAKARERIAALEAERDALVRELRESVAKIDELEESEKRWLELIAEFEEDGDKFRARVAELEAERDRLRGALEAVINTPLSWGAELYDAAQSKARAALAAAPQEEKPNANHPTVDSWGGSE